MGIWLAVLVALVPSLILFIFIAKKRKLMWLAFILGSFGWIVSFYARLPVLLILPRIVGSGILFFVITALLAGVFEEGLKFGFVKKIKFLSVYWKHVFSFGLGWGIVEAIIVITTGVLAALYIQMYGISSNLLVSAIERNFAILFHVAMAFIIYNAVTSSKLSLVFIAMTIHATVDFVSMMLHQVLRLPSWHVEAIILILATFSALYAYIIGKQK
jgi:uncharacterized membrane protein YhfC